MCEEGLGEVSVELFTTILPHIPPSSARRIFILAIFHREILPGTPPAHCSASVLHVALHSLSGP